MQKPEETNNTIQTLLEKGKQKNVLTYTEIYEMLDDVEMSAEDMDQLFETLEASGIDVLNDTIPMEEFEAEAEEDAVPVVGHPHLETDIGAAARLGYHRSTGKGRQFFYGIHAVAEAPFHDVREICEARAVKRELADRFEIVRHISLCNF